jgi:hypothetical protein
MLIRSSESSPVWPRHRLLVGPGRRILGSAATRRSRSVAHRRAGARDRPRQSTVRHRCQVGRRSRRGPYSPLGGGWLSGRYRKDGESVGPQSLARQRLANRFDLSRPENQRKLDAVDQLNRLAEEAGISLIELAIAFVLNHPAVTAAIIGPRTMEHLESQLIAAEVTLSDDVLDRIDQINPPGVTINHADNGWTQPALQLPDRRR